MRLYTAKRQIGCEVNIAPLIDVVFLLIIFFLTVSHITEVQVEPLALPEARDVEDENRILAGQLVINVLQDGAILISGKSHTNDTLMDMLSSTDPNGLSVVIRADRDTPWSKVSDILKGCSARGIDKAKLAVIEAQMPD